MKKEDIKCEIEPSNDDCLTQIRYAYVADEMAKHRDIYLKMINDGISLKQMQDEIIANEKAKSTKE